MCTLAFEKHRLVKSLAGYICLCSSSLSDDVFLLAKCTNAFLGSMSEGPGQPTTAEISLKSHISSKNVIECFIPYCNVSVVISVFQNG